MENERGIDEEIEKELDKDGFNQEIIKLLRSQSLDQTQEMLENESVAENANMYNERSPRNMLNIAQLDSTQN